MALYQQMECMCLSAPLSFGDVQSATMARFIEIILMALGRFSPGQLGADLTAALRATPSRAVIGAFTDVTHWREREQQEIAALTEQADSQRQRAEDAEAHRLEQERFVDVICHEIRNPLNGIVNNVDQLREGRRALRAMVLALPNQLGVDAIVNVLDDEDGMLTAIDLCASHQVRRVQRHRPNGPGVLCWRVMHT